MGMTQVMLAVAAAEDAADAKSLKMLRCYRSNLGTYLRGMDPKDPRKDYGGRKNKFFQNIRWFFLAK